MAKLFSREYLFEQNKLLKKPLAIHFIKDSDSYRNFGRYIIVNLIWEHQEIISLMKNYDIGEAAYTQGNVKAEPILDNAYSNDVVYKLKKVGFNTEDINFIEHHK